MKKYLSLILALCLPALLGGCGAVPLPMPESPTPPPAADTEEITYEVSTDPYEQTVTAEISIPSESMPIIFLGGRFTMAMAVLPTSSSGS